MQGVKERNALILENMGAITRMVDRMRATSRTFRRIPRDDLLQEAFVRILQTADTYDPDRGARFDQWVRYHLWARMADACCNDRVVYVPAWMQHLINPPPRKRPGLGPKPVLHKRHSGRVLHIRAMARAVKAMRPIVSLEGVDIAWYPKAGYEGPSVNDLIKCLNARDSAAIWLRYVEGQTLDQTARVLCVTRERARQIIMRAEDNLRKRLSWSVVRNFWPN